MDTDLVDYNGTKVVAGSPEQIEAAQKIATYSIDGVLFPRIPYGSEASGAGHRINNDTPLCKLSPAAAGEAEWQYRMESGFPVYWEMRRKARPWPLRVIQFFFGN
ncbi:hypothetical protein ACFONN_14895 [Dyella humi]|uniref:Uncharacterized protein n=1 Tax=Dyella humi TaxID=1770547 RepID=A0ABW8IM50_9GAMM